MCRRRHANREAAALWFVVESFEGMLNLGAKFTILFWVEFELRKFWDVIC